MSSDYDWDILDEKSKNKSSSTRSKQSQRPSKKELQEESHRILREIRKVPYKALSQKEKEKYESARQTIRNFPERHGRWYNRPASRNRNRPRRRRPRSRTPDWKSGAGRALKEYEEDLRRETKHLSNEEYKEFLERKLESAKQALLSDYETLQTGDKSNTTLPCGTFKKEGERGHYNPFAKRFSERKECRSETSWNSTSVKTTTSTKGMVGSSTDTQSFDYSIIREKDSDGERDEPESGYDSSKKQSDRWIYKRREDSKRYMRRFSEQDDEGRINSVMGQLESAKKRLAMVAKQNASTNVTVPDVNWNKQERSITPGKLGTSSNSSSTAMPNTPTNMPTISVAGFAKESNEEDLQVDVVDGNTQTKEEKESAANANKEESTELITVEHHHQVAIVDGFNPAKQLDAEQWAFIESKLLHSLDEMLLRTSGPYPIFDQMSSIKGYKILSCCNDFTLQWLKGKVAELAPPWFGARLNVVTKKELPTGPLAKISLPGPPISKNRLEQFIRNLNPEFPSQDWQVIQMKDNITDNGQEAIVMFNKESMEILPDRGYKIRVGISVVKVDPLDEVYRKKAEEASRLISETIYVEDSDEESTKSESGDSSAE